MKMKKILSLLVASLMVLSMAACSGKADETTTAQTTVAATTEAATTVAEETTTAEVTTAETTTVAEETTVAAETTTAAPAADLTGTLKVWLDNDDWANAVMAAYKEKYPNVTIEYEKVGSVDQRTKLTLDGPAGIGADVFITPHDHISQCITDGLSQELPADLQAKYEGLLLDAPIGTVKSEGKMFGVPISTENIALFYNKDLWGATPPASFEEIIEFAKTYNNEAENKFALKWQVDDSYHNYFFLTAGGMQLFGPNHDDFTKPGFDSPEAKKGVEFYMSLRDTVFNVNVADATWDTTVASFQKGEVPLTISGPWAIGDAKKNNVNFGVAKLPTINGVQPRCFSGNIIAQVSSYSQNKDLAFTFVDFLASAEGAKVLYDITGKLPALKDITVVPGLKDDAYLMGIQEQSPFADPMPVIPEMAQAWDAQKALFTFTWDKQLTIEEAQAKAIETYKTALQAAGKSY